MLLEDKVKIKVYNKNLKYYNNKGYNVKSGDIIYINVKDLPKYSRQKIYVKCDYCGIKKNIGYKEYYKITDNFNKKYSCKDCKSEKTKITNLEKYGVENVFQLDDVKDKSKKTMLKKYGVDHPKKHDSFKKKSEDTCLKMYGVKYPMQSEKIKQKTKNSNIEKYGVDVPSKSNLIKEKTKENNIKKYGVDHPMKLDILKDKLKKTNNIKYGFNSPLLNDNINYISKITLNNNYQVDNPLKSQIVKEKIKNTKIKNLKDKYEKMGLEIIDIDYDKMLYKVKCDNNENHYFDISTTNLYNRINISTKICTICNPINSYRNSGFEIKLQTFIKEKSNYQVLFNNKKIITPYELDIYIPELKIAFEFNGLWWHSELYKDKNYHLNKTEECEKCGIQLIHIYEDDWVYKDDIVKSIILNKLKQTPNKLFARKTEIKEINDNKLVREFLEKNHIQGFVGSKIKLGLFYENELVSLMTFGKRRIAMGKKKTNDNEFELLRFCNKLNTNITGGASKLFKYFINNYEPKEITTYADRSYSKGNLYKQLGFNYIGKTQPNYYYVIDGIRNHRFNFRKDVLVKEGFDLNKTEHEIMLKRKIYRIYDSGSLKYNFDN